MYQFLCTKECCLYFDLGEEKNFCIPHINIFVENFGKVGGNRREGEDLCRKGIGYKFQKVRYLSQHFEAANRSNDQCYGREKKNRFS